MKKNIQSITDNFFYLFHELYLFRNSSILLPFLGSASQIFLSLITIWIPKIILDLIMSRAGLSDLLRWIIITGVALLIASTINAIVHNCIDSCSQVFLFTRLKTKWEEKMMDLDYELFTSRSGKISAEKARNAISSPNFGVVTYMRKVTGLLECMGGFFALSTIIFALHPLILILLFIMFGIELWYGTHSETCKHHLQEERAQANRKINYIAYNTRGIREGKDIRIYSMVPWLRNIADTALIEKDRVEERTASYDLGKMLLNGLLIFLRNGCAYAYLVYQYFYGGMTIGDFTLYFSAIIGLGSFLSKLTQGYSSFIETDNYVTDFRLFMNLYGDKNKNGNEKEKMNGKKNGKINRNKSEKTDGNENKNGDENINLGKNREKVSIDILSKPVSFIWENVSFSYLQEDEEGNKTEIPVLKKINLSIKAGEKLAIVGENGAGKTTFVKLLCGLLKPQEGIISVNGVSLTDFDPEDYRNLFSAVFQKSGVLPVSIRDNIVLNIQDDDEAGKQVLFSESENRVLVSDNGNHVFFSRSGNQTLNKDDLGNVSDESREEIVRRCIRLANLEEKVRSLPEGLDTHLVKRITEHGTELSGGELQRLLLARALYKNAPVLILDEPTAALDPIAENEIYQAYNKLTEGKTSVFISHRLASTRFCDRILVMENGEIVEIGTHDELMEQKGRYAEMFEVQSRYYTDQEVFI